MVAWWDRWLRGRDETPHRDVVDVFVRTSTRPEAFLDQHEGHWIRDTWPSPSVDDQTRALPGPRELVVDPDVGTAAWIDCAGHLPWGLSTDQREDDARSLVWEWDGDVGDRDRPAARAAAGQRRRARGVVVGEAVRRLPRRHLGADHARQPRPRLPRRRARTASTVAAGPRRGVRRRGGARRLRLPARPRPDPAALGGRRRLAEHDRSPGPGDAHRARRVARAAACVPVPRSSHRRSHRARRRRRRTRATSRWTVTRDVLRDTTTCAVRHGAEYDVPHDGRASEQYAGAVGRGPSYVRPARRRPTAPTGSPGPASTSRCPPRCAST